MLHDLNALVKMECLWYISPSDYIPDYLVCRYTAAIRDISNNITIARDEDALLFVETNFSKYWC